MPTGRIRSDVPSSLIRNTDMPTLRASFQSVKQTSSSRSIVAGNPLGLLLVLTYSTASTLTTLSGGDGPFVNIRLE